MSADADDRETLQDLMIAAFNDAAAKAEQVSQQRMSAVTAGLPLPPGMKLF
jgi:DNA-binding protein YbaB